MFIIGAGFSACIIISYTSLCVGEEQAAVSRSMALTKSGKTSFVITKGHYGKHNTRHLKAHSRFFQGKTTISVVRFAQESPFLSLVEFEWGFPFRAEFLLESPKNR